MFKKKFILLFLILHISFLYAQSQLQTHYKQNKKFNTALLKIIKDAGLDSSYFAGEDGIETISFAVIDLKSKKPILGTVNAANFIYPASVYKMYVAMEVLKQISEGKYSLNQPYIVHSPNDVDRTREISYDPRPLLKNGDTVTINYLLDLMITRSDNSAANCLIDLAGRKSINSTMHDNNWNGSEVTRKFLSRKFESPGYDTIRGTETCALHAADFMYKIYTNQLINPWVSQQMKALLARQLDTSKLSTGLPDNAMFYHKTGWWSYFTHDVGIVDEGEVKYIIALFLPLKEEVALQKFKIVSQQVYQLMKQRQSAF